MNKKGISTVVATVLIILLTVAAVAIVWATIIPMIKGQLSKGTLCLTANSQVSIKNEGYTCWNETANKVNVQIGQGSKDSKLVGVQILIHENGGTSSKDITTGLPGINEEKVFPIAYTNSTVEGPGSITIAPIIKVGNTQETCGVSSKLALRVC